MDRQEYYFSLLYRTKEQITAFSELWDQLQHRKDDRCIESMESVKRVCVDGDLILENGELLALCESIAAISPWIEWVISLSPVLRAEDEEYLQGILEILLSDSCFHAVLTSSLEGIGFFLEQETSFQKIRIYGDHSLYLWNEKAVGFWKNKLSGACIPLELKAGEQNALLKACPVQPYFWEKVIYGYLPMMLTANCVAKTTEGCRKFSGKVEKKIISLTDRKGIAFPVLLNCRHCMNIIYNSIPISLHAASDPFSVPALHRLMFTMESGAETRKILEFFLMKDFRTEMPPYGEYTTGHEKRGVL